MDRNLIKKKLLMWKRTDDNWEWQNNIMRTPSARGGCAGKKKAAAATPCCTKVGLKRGPWTAEEDELLTNYIKREGEGRWRMMPKKAGLLRCGKSCRLRWMNYLRPSIKRGHITADEEDLIIRLHRLLGNRYFAFSLQITWALNFRVYIGTSSKDILIINLESKR